MLLAPNLLISVAWADIKKFPADVLVLGRPKGDLSSNSPLLSDVAALGVSPGKLTPDVDQTQLLNTLGTCTSPQLLLVGCPPATEFGYTEIRHFFALALSTLRKRIPHVRHVATVVHGPALGLDQAACFDQQVNGVIDSVLSATAPQSLTRISLAEGEPDTFASLLIIAENRFGSAVHSTPESSEWRLTSETPDQAPHQGVRGNGGDPDERASIFVAMPFSSNLRDIWKFGIEAPVHEAGWLCERVDQQHFTGDILSHIKQRIERAILVIADITEANPNVLLEVGYAWGAHRPTLLIARRSWFTSERVPFDVRGYRCVLYDDAVELEERVRVELSKLDLRARDPARVSEIGSPEQRNPEELFYLLEKKAILESALSRLGLREQEIVRRFYILEQSSTEICEDLGLTETQFRLIKSRAKARFGELGRYLIRRPR